MQAALHHECGAETCEVAWGWVFQCGSEPLGEQIPTAKPFPGVAVSHRELMAVGLQTRSVNEFLLEYKGFQK